MQPVLIWHSRRSYGSIGRRHHRGKKRSKDTKKFCTCNYLLLSIGSFPPSSRVTRSRLGAVPRHAPYTTSTPISGSSTFDPTLPSTGKNVPSQQRTTKIEPTLAMPRAPISPLPTSDGEEKYGSGQENDATCLGYATPPGGRTYLTKDEEAIKREEITSHRSREVRPAATSDLRAAFLKDYGRDEEWFSYD